MTNNDNIDFATLRLECASNLLTMINIQLSGSCDRPSDQVFASAIFGIHMLVDDAYKALS